jgi:hypothetical protein
LQVLEEINIRSNDQAIRAGQDSEVLELHAEQYSRDRQALLGGAGASQDTNRRVNDFVMQYNDDREDQQRDMGRLLKGASASQDTNVRLNDHIIQSREEAEAILQHIERYQQDRRIAQEEARKAELARRETQLAEVLKWLSTPGDLQAQYHDNFMAVWQEFKDTGKWILRETKMLNWMAADGLTHSMVWMNGRKGAGGCLRRTAARRTQAPRRNQG